MNSTYRFDIEELTYAEMGEMLSKIDDDDEIVLIYRGAELHTDKKTYERMRKLHV